MTSHVTGHGVAAHGMTLMTDNPNYEEVRAVGGGGGGELMWEGSEEEGGVEGRQEWEGGVEGRQE